MNDKFKTLIGIKTYYKGAPLIKQNEVTREEFEISRTGYIAYSNQINNFDKIIEKIVNGDIQLVSIIVNCVNEEEIQTFVKNNYPKTIYEIERRITQFFSIIVKYYNNGTISTLIRKYNANGYILSEASFEDGDLLEYNEIKYDINNKLLENKIFMGKNAWSIERYKY
jgi:hypothetical protein